MPILKHLCDEWEKQGISHAEMSRRSNIPDSTLRRLRKNPEAGANIETIIALARALNVSIDELAGLARVAAAPEPIPIEPAPVELSPIEPEPVKAPEPQAEPEQQRLIFPCDRCPYKELSGEKEDLYKSREVLYERALTQKNKYITRLSALCTILTVAWIVLFFVANPV